MTGQPSDDGDSLSPEAVRAVDRACDQFEGEWRAGRRPSLEEYLTGTDAEMRPALMRELLLLEWELRRRDGDTPAPGDYYTRFPDSPAVIDGALAEAPPPPTDRYQLLGEVGHGGIGVVFRGHDRRLGRDLAVKVLKESHRGRADLCRRFVAEAQIGGQLQHPAIVPVYELGEFDDHRLFFTMRLVEGQTLAELLRARTDPSKDRPRLLGVFGQVCLAVAYAHSKGVVHRDLKPSNVMVGEFGEVQVMDWGLAKQMRSAECGMRNEEDSSIPHSVFRTPHSDETRTGLVLGTLAYMPPEQARGEADVVDARADVFGLGAILCEVLTGRPPYGEGPEEEMLGRVARGELDDALNQLGRCGADPELLDLTRRCLAADPVGRPADAGAVAAEMTNYLTSVDQKLQTAREERAAAEAREQQARATASAERRARRLTLGLAASLLVLSLLGGGAWWWVGRQTADRQARAEQALANAEALRDRQKWPEALAAAGHARELLGDGEGELGRRAREMQADLETARELEEGRLVQATEPVAGRRFPIEQALPRYTHAFAAQGIRVGETDPALASALIRDRPAVVLGTMVAALDDWLRIAREGGRPEREWLAAVVRQADADGWRQQVREAVAGQDRAALERLAGEIDPAGHPPTTFQFLGRALGDAGANESAVAVLRRAQRLYPDDFWINNYLGFYLLRLRPPRADEAARYYSAAVALRPGVATAHANLAYALAIKGDWDGVIEVSRRAVELNPTSPQGYNNLGSGLHRKGDRQAARAALEKALQLSPDYAEAHNNLGLVLFDDRDTDRAAEYFRRATQLAPGLAHAHNNLGLVLHRQDDPAGALRAFARAIELVPDFAQARYNRGAQLLAVRRPEEAVEDLSLAVRLKPEFGEAHLRLGQSLALRGEKGRALAAFEDAVRAGLTSAALYVELGASLVSQGEFGRAGAAYREAIRREPDDASAHFGLGNALQRECEWGKAAEAFGEAARLGFNPATAHRQAGHCLREQGEFREALAAYRRALRPGVSGSLLTQLGREVKEVERLVELDDKLPAVLCGLHSPSDADELTEYARLCSSKQLYAASAQLYRRTFAARPALADDLGRGHRYHAARAAARAGLGEGCDAVGADAEGRARWRYQALAWLRADLALWEGRPAPATGARMHLWLRDKCLAGLRESDRLAQLPDAEAGSWLHFWAGARALQFRCRVPGGHTLQNLPMRKQRD